MIAGRYELEAEIGRGGMGAVWRGRDTVLGRTVALKRIGFAPGGITPDALRAQREAQLAAKLNHANITAVFDLVTETTDDGGQQQWLVMEYVEGTDLAQMVRERGRLSPDEVAPVLAQVASALAAAHGAGIVHRDVKPSNILVAPTGQVKLSDFGIAKAATDPTLTQTGLVTGSPAYLSPEVASGQQATPASDVWSWGATLFHALEGHPPYEVGDNMLGALYRIVHEAPPTTAHAGWLAPALESTMTREVGARWPIRQAQEFLEAGPRIAPLPARTRRVRAVDTPAEGSPAAGASTQVLPVGSPAPTVAAAPAVDPVGTAPRPVPAPVSVQPPPLAPPHGSGGNRRDASRRRRRQWPLVLLAALVLVGVVVAAFLIGTRGGDDEAGDQPGASSSGAAGSPSASPSAAEPTAEDMEQFAADYVQTATDDPRAGFRELTTDYQEASGGFAGYNGFWGNVESSEILDGPTADVDALTVTYRYRYVYDGSQRAPETVTLQLVFQDGTYKISGS